MNGQNHCDFTKYYEDFISIDRLTDNEKDFLTKQVVETNKKSCVSELINNNIMFFDYLLTNFSSNSNDKNLLQINDSLSLRKNYFEGLKNDSLFNSIMNELMSKTFDKTISKDSLNMNQLLNIAVKYFSINRLSKEGYYVGKVCAGFNSIGSTEKIRKPFVEAFCFSSIFKHYISEEFNMYEEFVNAIKELNTINLGIEEGEKLLRAQGAMFVIMKNNDKLRKMLQVEYEKQKEYLPFILIY
ncbi:MAG: hypothetical protein PHU35_06665 [Bacteroidales bacterium]|nr:hypothetical protein [Bacteroidales bacterium]